MQHSILQNPKLIYLLFENWYLLINIGEATSQIELNRIFSSYLVMNIIEA
jgi:hypothetical protein